MDGLYSLHVCIDVEGITVVRFATLLCLCALLLAGCDPGPAAVTETPPDPLALVTEASENIRQTQTFRMIVEQTGQPYFIGTDLGTAQFRRAEAQYVAPDRMQANVRILVVGLPTEADVYSHGANQWLRNDVLTGNRWVNTPFSPGFNPETLIAQETGFQASLAALIDMQYVGVETLESGVSAYHLTATANGEDVTALLAGLIYMTGTVNVDVYIDTVTRIPVRFVIVEPETVSEEYPEPTTWTIDIFDIDEPAELDDPEAAAGTAEAAATGEATAESTSATVESTPDATADATEAGS